MQTNKWRLIMFIDPIAHENIEEETIEMQFGGWVFESHCWGPPNEENIQTCRWCGREVEFGIILTKDYPLCLKNIVIRNLIKKHIGKTIDKLID